MIQISYLNSCHDLPQVPRVFFPPIPIFSPQTPFFPPSPIPLPQTPFFAPNPGTSRASGAGRSGRSGRSCGTSAPGTSWPARPAPAPSPSPTSASTSSAATRSCTGERQVWGEIRRIRGFSQHLRSSLGCVPQLRGAAGEPSAAARAGQVPAADPAARGQQVTAGLGFGVKRGGFGVKRGGFGQN